MIAQDWSFIVLRTTAILWVVLAAWGIFRRLRRLHRLNQIRLVEPVDQEDADYLASVKYSTHLRLVVKIVLLLGGLIALFGWVEYVLVWRCGVITILVLMATETSSVDAIRKRLALSEQAREAQKEGGLT